ncbi:MAG: hypothetical protein ISEC1_P1300 [Thiomicrorhabdus sp.]|nr:MAG: hypothetical protein ISEC1_P1300 [Thiomicrorhabdus sp.]
MKSLQSRLNLGLSVALTLLMVLLWWFSSTGLNHIGEQMVNSRMKHDGEALLASLQKDPEGQWEVKSSQIGHIYQRVFSGHYYSIEIEEETGNQILHSRSWWDFNPEKRLARTVENTLPTHMQGPNNQGLLVWSSTFKLNQKSITILVTEDITPLRKSLDQFTQIFAIISLLLLISILLLQRWMIKRAFNSLKQVTNELEALSEGELTQLSKEVPQEIEPLVEEVNRLLQLLAQRLQRSRNATGNLAHSLKHPLNLLVQIADQQPDNSQIKTELKTNTQQIYQLIERELKRARIAGAGLPGQHFDANDELPSLVDVLRRVYQHKDIKISYKVDHPCIYTADRNDMLELLGNLLDNACKWSNQTIKCSISCSNHGVPKGLEITIEDDGKGCSKKQLQYLTERGVRIDETVQGSGLGLAIVKDIVELYQGVLSFEASELGGLKVIVKLP